MIYDIYTSIKSRLTAKVPEVKHVALWNGQILADNLGKENIFATPAVFVEWLSVNYTANSAGVQQGEALINVHVVTKIMTNDEALPYTTANAVFVGLHGYSEDFYTRLTRVAEIPDMSHDQVVDYVIQFQITVTDETGSDDKDFELVQLPDLQLVVTPDLLIDAPTFDNLRAGVLVKTNS